MNPLIADPNQRVVFFPVRHHSPAAARLVRELIQDMQPAAILIEGPADYNDRLSELALPHQLPIAIYSYVHLSNGLRRGAFYPFCEYSPEWQAIQAAPARDIAVQFIDLPWVAALAEDIPVHRYADAELRGGDYIRAVCAELGVESLDDAWDTLFEIDPALTVAEYLQRCHQFCYSIRASDPTTRWVDRQREAYMVTQIQAAMDSHAGKILVVTGGFHSYVLFAAVFNQPFEPDLPPPEPPITDTEAEPITIVERGVALTPYSYERLDSLAGYEAGMPNPGFYHHVWKDRQAKRGPSYRGVLAQTAAALREQNQTASTADLIAVESMAQGLAELRGHSEVWRRDLVDGIMSALVKDELAYGQTHPFLAAVYDVLRGDQRGKLAAGTTLPPLVKDIEHHLTAHDLAPQRTRRDIDLDLLNADELVAVQMLHRVRVLSIPGFERVGGTDLATRTNLTNLWERWRIVWQPEFDAACIEAAVYGATLAEASAARLLEQAEKSPPNAETAALLLLQAALMGFDTLTASLHMQLTQLIQQDGNFLTMAGALGHLLYLYRYDEALGTTGLSDIGALLTEAYTRSLWLLESLGQAEGQDKELLRRVRLILDTFERCAASLNLDRAAFVDVFSRVSANPSQMPTLRGAAMGALWTLGEAATDALVAQVNYFAAPDVLGDYLTGLFHLAREAAQRHPDVVQSIDALLMGYNNDQFLEALPPLRLAFSYFTPREKDHMARTLMETLGLSQVEPLPALEVTPEMAAQAMALENQLFKAVEKYGLRGGSA